MADTEPGPGLTDADDPVRLSEHLYAFPDTCNAYAVVDGDAALVVDPGSGAIAEALDADVRWALHTHHHRDQCWGTWRLVEAGARVAAPEYERHLFADVETFWEGKRIYDNYNDRSTFDTLPESVPVEATLDDYGEFEWRDYAFEVLPAKGHTFGSSALLAEVDGREVAFTGDLIHEGGRLHQLHQLEYEYGDVNRLGVKWVERPRVSRHHETAMPSRTTPRLVSGLPFYPRKAEGVKVPFAFTVPDLRAS